MSLNMSHKEAEDMQVQGWRANAIYELQAVPIPEGQPVGGQNLEGWGCRESCGALAARLYYGTRAWAYTEKKGLHHLFINKLLLQEN